MDNAKTPYSSSQDTAPLPWLAGIPASTSIANQEVEARLVLSPENKSAVREVARRVLNELKQRLLLERRLWGVGSDDLCCMSVPIGPIEL